MAMVDWVGAEMKVVDGMYAGQSQGGLVACWEMSVHFPCARLYTDHIAIRCTALGRVKPELVGLPGKTLIRDAKRRLRFIVHAAGWLH